ncbi:MAG: hypothetical protein QOC99_181, partial [Acidobacteriota bacterium]|nr:hypothetical protein [Acidobacteriota bacterium]
MNSFNSKTVLPSLYSMFNLSEEDRVIHRRGAEDAEEARRK